jgi:CubicO group peptidase (beta-lactamase class C family)
VAGYAAVLEAVGGWDVPHAAVAVIAGGDEQASFGDTALVLRIASVGKLLAAYSVLLGVEEGVVALSDPVGPPGSTLRHLLAHASGYGFESDANVLAAPGTRRIYSNRGIEEATEHLARHAGMSFSAYLGAGVLEPLGMTRTELRGSPAFAMWSCVDDLARFAAELLSPRLLDGSTVTAARTVQFPHLAGVLPGVGRFDPLAWGLGFELRAHKCPHWTGNHNSPATFGHFGGSGSFLWVDPDADVALACLTGREFGPWALDAWPPLSDAVLAVSRVG